MIIGATNLAQLCCGRALGALLTMSMFPRVSLLVILLIVGRQANQFLLGMKDVVFGA